MQAPHPIFDPGGRSHSAVYGWTWAQSRVIDFKERFGRGWKNLLDLKGTSDSELFRTAVGFIRHDQRNWEILKNVVKSLNSTPPPHLPPAEGKKYYTFVKANAVDRYLDDKTVPHHAEGASTGVDQAVRVLEDEKTGGV